MARSRTTSQPAPAPEPVRRWNMPGVEYPEPAPVAKPRKITLPPGCPRYVANLHLLGPWVEAAGLWPGIPCRSTLYRWNKYGLIVYKKGATGCRMVDVGATLLNLTPEN